MSSSTKGQVCVPTPCPLTPTADTRRVCLCACGVCERFFFYLNNVLLCVDLFGCRTRKQTSRVLKASLPPHHHSFFFSGAALVLVIVVFSASGVVVCHHVQQKQTYACVCVPKCCYGNGTCVPVGYLVVLRLILLLLGCKTPINKENFGEFHVWIT